MKTLKTLLAVLFFCAGSLLSAQEFSDILLYFLPTTGGLPKEREFFDANIPLEIRNAYYKVVDSPDEADFLVSVAIAKNEDSSYTSYLTLGLTTAVDQSPLIEISYDYDNVEEMYSWNLGTLLAPAIPSLSTAPAASGDWREAPWLYLGVRGGGAFTGYAFQGTSDYNAGYSAGMSAEVGLAVEIRPFRFLSFQLEGVFAYEAFNAPKVKQMDSGLAYSSDTFRSKSLMFPLIAKVPLKFEKFVLSLFAGAYYIVAPGGVERTTGDSNETESIADYRIKPPFGFTVGLEAGFPLGPGVLFTDLRYYKRGFGTSSVGSGGPLYIQDRISLCIGYKLGFLRKETKNGVMKMDGAIAGLL
ncbi:MAG: PorT family protein [Treponema sp.]|jgi:hypothetical protein|nr:PorT family protein [Treponema sp.]